MVNQLPVATVAASAATGGAAAPAVPATTATGAAAPAATGAAAPAATSAAQRIISDMRARVEGLVVDIDSVRDSSYGPAAESLRSRTAPQESAARAP